MGRMNAAVRWIVWGTMPVGALIGGEVGTAIGVRPTLGIGLIGSWAAGFWVYFSPLRRMRDLPAQPELEVDRAPGSGVPGQGGGELPDSPRAPLGH